MEISSNNPLAQDGLELLNKIFLSASEGIIIVDEKGEILLANRKSESIFGYKKEELTGKSIENLIPHKSRKAHVNYRAEYIKNPVSRPMGIGRYLTGVNKNNQEIPVEVSLSYVDHNEKKFVVAFITDISLRKEQEDKIAKSNKKLEEYANMLESKVKERTQELEHLNLGLKSQIRERKLAENALRDSLEDLKKAENRAKNALLRQKDLNEMQSRFISMASHEFRTPLTTIQSSANLIGRYPNTDQQTNRQKHIKRIESSVQNLTNILNDFLSLDKLESGAIDLKIEDFNLYSLFEEIQEAFDATLKSGQSILIQGDTEQSLNSDPHLIKNILFNLISNASKYSDEGAKIHILVAKSGESIKITVKDEGIGIPEKEQKNLFTRFFRANNVTNIQGTGLGLNIVQRYVDLIGGEINFTSKENQGSEFDIKIPYKLNHNT